MLLALLRKDSIELEQAQIGRGTNEGLLYQWCGAMNTTISERSRGICPAGFHMPSDCEWMYLEHGQGMALSEQEINNNWRANTTDNQGAPGYKLRSAGSGQTNARGFSALLAGSRNAIVIYSFMRLAATGGPHHLQVFHWQITAACTQVTAACTASATLSLTAYLFVVLKIKQF